MNTPTLYTERLILRRFEESDLEAFYTLMSDPDVNTYLPLFPMQSREEAKDFLNQHYLAAYQKESGYKYAIALKDTHLVIGYIVASLSSPAHDFGYALRKEYHNQSIVTEAGEALIHQLKQDGVSYITATHDINNIASGRVMQKLGMSYQYSYKEQWMPKNKEVIFRMYQLNLDGRKRVYEGYWEKYKEHFVEEAV